MFRVHTACSDLYFSQQIARSLNDILSSKSAAFGKDSCKKPIRNISILPPLPVVAISFSILSVVAELHFTAKRLKRVREQTKGGRQRNDTVPRSTGRVIFTGRKWSNSVAVPSPRAAASRAGWEIQSRIYFQRQTSPLDANTVSG